MSQNMREGADSAQSGHSPEPPTPLHSSTRRPRLLDLFAGAGGAAVGYYRAGFEVVGVDIEPQPNYPFEFFQADALDVLDAIVKDRGVKRLWPNATTHLAAIHASPPCQAYSSLSGFTTADYPKLVDPVRELLRATGLPYVIENVAGAPLLNPVRLCGSSFGLRVWRHRLFETSFPVWMVPPCSHAHHPKPIDVTGTGGPSNKPRTAPGGGLSRKPKNLADARDAMGIDWMTRPELAEAIPPAMTEWLGHHLLAHVQQEAKAA